MRTILEKTLMPAVRMLSSEESVVEIGDL